MTRHIAWLALGFLTLNGVAHAASCGSARLFERDRILAMAEGPIRLDRAVEIVRLAPACDADEAPRGRTLLVADDLRAAAQPGVLYTLALAQAGRKPEPIGVLNLFSAQKPDVSARPRRISYDVTKALRALSVGRRAGVDLIITARGAPRPDGNAAIDRLLLVRRAE